jgi:hypothetical protein
LNPIVFHIVSGDAFFSGAVGGSSGKLRDFVGLWRIARMPAREEVAVSSIYGARCFAMFNPWPTGQRCSRGFRKVLPAGQDFAAGRDLCAHQPKFPADIQTPAAQPVRLSV